jgi:hypothetical protein
LFIASPNEHARERHHRIKKCLKVQALDATPHVEGSWEPGMKTCACTEELAEILNLEGEVLTSLCGGEDVLGDQVTTHHVRKMDGRMLVKFICEKSVTVAKKPEQGLMLLTFLLMTSCIWSEAICS